MHNSEKVCSNDYEILPLLLRPSHVPHWGFVCPACHSPSCCFQNNVARVSPICNSDPTPNRLSGINWLARWAAGFKTSWGLTGTAYHISCFFALTSLLKSKVYGRLLFKCNIVLLHISISIYLYTFSTVSVSELCHCLAVKHLWV